MPDHDTGSGPFADDDPEDRFDDGDPVAVRVETLEDAVREIVAEDPTTDRHHARHAAARYIIDRLIVERAGHRGELVALRDALNGVDP